MQPLIEQNREQIAQLCRTHHVRRLSAFGSAVRDDFDPARSDVDLLIEFEELGEMEYSPNYFSLLRSFDELFGRKVDLLTERFVRNPYLLKAIDEDRVLLYAA